MQRTAPSHRFRQPVPIRVMHWLNAVFLVTMAGSGLQILAAYPSLGPRGASFGWYPLQGKSPPPLVTIGHWLAGARHWHFAFAWFFTANALLYVLYLVASGEWRHRLFWPPRDARNAWETLLHDLRLRKTIPSGVGLYNGMQRLAYSAVLGAGALVIVSGIALYKPVQLRRVTALLGGYDAARAIHLLILGLLVIFTVVHVVQVVAHPRTLGDMVIGGRGRTEGAR